MRKEAAGKAAFLFHRDLRENYLFFEMTARELFFFNISI